MKEVKDNDTKIVGELIDYMKTAKPEGNDWNEVSKKVYFSRILCCLCTLNGRFADELDNDVDNFMSEKKTGEACLTQYGEIELKTDETSGKTYVSLKAENV